MLRDATLNPVADGNYPMIFSIWDAATAGTKRWGDESHPAVQTTNGMFSVYLGSSQALGNLFQQYGALWLEISANTGTGMETYAPRVPLASVPYAQYAPQAGNADTLDGLHASAFAGASHNHAGEHITTGTVNTDRLNVGTASTQVARGNHTHNTLSGPNNSPANAVVVDGAGNMGVGTATPGQRLEVNGAGNMGVGTATPGQRLEVNGALQFTGNGATGETSGVISRAPRVIHSGDPGGGCPGTRPIDSPLWTVNFTLTRPAAVHVTAFIIGLGTGNRSLDLYVAGAHRSRTLGFHGSTDAWDGYSLSWSGVLPAGTHSAYLRSPNLDRWGCGVLHGAIDISIFE
jgi:hypothetical protein